MGGVCRRARPAPPARPKAEAVPEPQPARLEEPRPAIEAAPLVSEVRPIPLDETGRNCVVTAGTGLVHLHFSQPAESLAISPDVAQQLAFMLLTKAVWVIQVGGR